MVGFTRRKTDLDYLLEKCDRQINRQQRAVVRKAYHLAEDAHKFQKRRSGEPYIVHPLNVAVILADLKLDHETICAGLLHDVLEDTDISYGYLQQEFGETIAQLVESVTKLPGLKNEGNFETKQANNIRRLILATVKDSRVILIKLADRLHNMRTLQYFGEQSVKRIAQETLEIFAPLAGRFGIYKIKWELEDLSLYYLDYPTYQLIKNNIAEKRDVRDKKLDNVILLIRQKLKEARIKARVEGRSKHFYSIYLKMKDKTRSFDEIYDLSGIRIIVDNIQECYAAMGIVHSIWNPFPGRFKDYISVPKSNAYQSLHTTVAGSDGKNIEVQIRTERMHAVAELGIAAHWAYKEKEINDQHNLVEQFDLLREISLLEESGSDATQFFEELKDNLLDEEIFVFTPKGEIIAMPRESTVLDFAFRIHTELGLKCYGAKIENRTVSIRTQLKSGDQVLIITQPNIKPSANWINILKTSHGRAKLRSWLRKNDPDLLPESKNTRENREKGEQLVLLPEARPKKAPRKDLAPKKLVEWAGETNFESRFAQCCNPLPGNAIRGYITKNNVISVHKKECPGLQSLLLHAETAERVIQLNWSGQYDSFRANLAIRGKDRQNLYLDIVKNLSNSGANILSAKATTSVDGQIHDTFTIEIDSHDHLNNIIDSLQKIENISEVYQVMKNPEVIEAV